MEPSAAANNVMIEGSSSAETSAFGIVDGYHPCLPDGEYEVQYMYWETVKQQHGGKAIVHFAIVSEDCAGIEILRYYNVRELVGPPKKSGKFKVGDRCDLVREYRRLLGDPDRLDRISLNRYRNKRIIVSVRQVSSDWKENTLPESAFYSVIGELLRIIPEE